MIEKEIRLSRIVQLGFVANWVPCVRVLLWVCVCVKGLESTYTTTKQMPPMLCFRRFCGCGFPQLGSVPQVAPAAAAESRGRSGAHISCCLGTFPKEREVSLMFFDYKAFAAR